MKTLATIFKELPGPDLSSDFEAKIFREVRLRRKKQLQARFLLSIVGSLASLAALIGTGAFFGQALLQSEFLSLASLLFSDAAVVVGYGGDFAFSLLETLPVIPIVLLLLPLFTLSLSMSFLLPLIEKRGDRRYFHFSYR